MRGALQSQRSAPKEKSTDSFLGLPPCAAAIDVFRGCACERIGGAVLAKAPDVTESSMLSCIQGQRQGQMLPGGLGEWFFWFNCPKLCYLFGSEFCGQDCQHDDKNSPVAMYRLHEHGGTPRLCPVATSGGCTIQR